MNSCELRQTRKFQNLKQISGASQLSITSKCQEYINKYQRYPELDEIPKSNSEKYLREQLDVKQKYGNLYTTKEDLLNYTQAESVEQANIELNNIHRDLTIDLFEEGNSVRIEITKRPSKYTLQDEVYIDYQEDESPEKIRHILANKFNDMQKRFGIQINVCTEEELKEMEIDVPNVALSKAFILDGQIYINASNVSFNEPIKHELTHMLLGFLRFSNPDLYYNLVGSVEGLKNYDSLYLEHQNKTRSDANEEIFVSEFAKFLDGQESLLDQVDDKVKHEIFYNINRGLDSLLEGNYSVNSINLDTLYNNSIIGLSKKVQSKILNNTGRSSIDLDSLHRLCNNRKSELMRSGELAEYCG